jgi:hypothetical protein
MSKDFRARRDVDNLKVVCGRCQEHMRLADLQKHEKECRLSVESPVSRSYEGARPYDCDLVGSTMRTPKLFFAEYVQAVLKQVHPGLHLSFAAFLVMDDLLWDTLCRIVDNLHADDAGTTTTFAEVAVKTSALADIRIVGDRGGGRVLCLSAYPAVSADSVAGLTCWVDRSELPAGLRGALAEWDSLTPPKKTAGFKKWLKAARKQTMGWYPGPVSTTSLQAAMSTVLNDEVNKHAIAEGNKAVTKFKSSGKHLSSKSGRKSGRDAGLQFSVGRVGALFVERTGHNVDILSAVYLTAVLEYVAAEVLELSGNAAKELKTQLYHPPPYNACHSER